MSIDPQWISAVASGLGCGTLLLVAWQVKTNKWQVKIDLERGRREKAIDLIKEVEESREQGKFKYIKLMFALNPDEVKLVYKEKPIPIRTSLAKQFLPECVSDEKADYVSLESECVVKIRSAMMGMLNTVERIALAYKYSVADQEMLNVTFKNFFIENKFLENCITLIEKIGENGWPVVKELPPLMEQRSRLRRILTTH